MPESTNRIQIMVAIIGLVGVLGAALISSWPNIFRGRSPGQASTSSSKQVEPAREPKPVSQPGPAHAILNHGTFTNPLRSNRQLYSYDFETSQQLSECSGAADFSFKPNVPNDPRTNISVSTCFKATYAPGFSGRRPWDVPVSEFIGNGQPHPSVSQDEWIPCRTGWGNYCQFALKIESNGDLIIRFTVFNAH